VKDFFNNWNISAHNWLKYYVFMRQLDNKKKGGVNFTSTTVTFTVSAIWHGFYPGYYVFFTGAALMDYHMKICEKKLSPYFEWMPIWAVKIISYTWCYVACAYFAIGFTLLGFDRFHPVYMSMNYYFHIVLIGSLILLLSLP